MAVTGLDLEERHVVGIEVQGARECQGLIVKRIDVAAVAPGSIPHTPAQGHPAGDAQDRERSGQGGARVDVAAAEEIVIGGEGQGGAPLLLGPDPEHGEDPRVDRVEHGILVDQGRHRFVPAAEKNEPVRLGARISAEQLLHAGLDIGFERERPGISGAQGGIRS